MTWEIRPQVGIGPLCLGMTRRQVREAMFQEAIRPSGKKAATIDCYYDNSVQVSFDRQGRADFIEVSSSAFELGVKFRGVDVFDVDAPKLVSHIEKQAAWEPALSRPPGEYLFPPLILSLWNASKEYDYKRNGKRRVFATVGVGNENYLRGIQELRQEFSRILEEDTWPGKKPSKTLRAAVDLLRSIYGQKGILIGLDADGEVRMVMFWVHPQISESIKKEVFACLKGFRKLVGLNFAYFTGPPVTDEDVVLLKDLPELQHLILAKTATSADGLKHLKRLTKLTHLTLPDTVEARGFKHISFLPSLISLSIHLGKKAELGLRELSHLPRLRFLRLHHDVTNAGLKHLMSFGGLRKLEIWSEHLTDASVPLFEPLAHLASLEIRDCLITKKGEKALKKLLPQTEVSVHKRFRY